MVIEMKNSKKFTFKGTWWPYKNINNKIPGTLEIINNKKISLITDTLFPEKNGVHTFPEKIGTVLGETLNKKPITLLNCLSLVGSNYNSTMAIIGEHYEDFDDIKFKKIKINYSLLNIWAYSDWIKSYTVKNNKYIRNYFDKDNIKIKIEEFNLIVDFQFNLKMIDKNPLNKERITFIYISSKEPKGLSEWWDVITILRNFMTLGLNVPVYPGEFIGFTDGQKQVKIHRLAYGYNFNSIEEINRKGKLFTLKNIEDDFSIYLNNWFNKSEKLNRIITNYYSILNNPDMYEIDKLLNYVSLLEGYHRFNKENEIVDQKDFNKKVNKILNDAAKCLEEEEIIFLKENINLFGYEKRLAQRLKELLNENKSLITLNSEDKGRFAFKVKDTRDYWAHKLIVAEDRLLTGLELSKAVIALEMLLITCLLREVGLQDDLLIKIFKRDNKFNYFHNNIINLFKFKT